MGLGLLAVAAMGALVGCGERADGERAQGPREGVPGEALLSGTPQGAGEAVDYAYDGAGNLLALKAPATVAVTIASFHPTSGTVGQVVTVVGAGFRPSPGATTVGIAGVPAQVLSVTTGEIRFVVPPGASTGPISVACGQTTALSGASFVVLSSVVVTGFSPAIGGPGTWVTVEGANFDLVPAANTVRIGAGAAVVRSASPSALLVTAGTATSSGKITVTNPAGTAESQADFFRVPTSLAQWDVGFRGRTSVGAPQPTTIPSNGGLTGLLLFDALPGQVLTVFVSGATVPGSTLVTIQSPANSNVASTWVMEGGEAKLAPAPLALGGTYAVVVTPPEGSTGKVEVRVLADARAIVTADGPPATLQIANGQNGRLVFTGDGDAYLGFACTAFATTPAGTWATLILTDPAGAVLVNTTTTGAALQLPRLPSNGSYSLIVRPNLTAAIDMTCVLSRARSELTTLGAPALNFQSTRPGQSSRYSFDASAGDRVGLGVQSLATTPAGGRLYLYVYKPDGSLLTLLYADFPTSFQLPALPATGRYTVAVYLNSISTAAASLLLSKEISGAIAAGGPAVRFTTARVGQAGRYSYTGSAGQRVSLRATGGAGLSTNYLVAALKPGGSLGQAQITSGQDLKLSLVALPASGQYEVTVVPDRVTVGTVDLTLVSTAIDQLVVGGPTKTVALGAAQNGRYTFTLTAGDLVGLGATAISRSPAGGTISLSMFKPDGSAFWSASLSAGTSWQLPAIGTSGTYAMDVTPSGTGTTSMALTLSSALTGSLTSGGPALRFQTARPGQSASYQFAGNAGQGHTLRLTAGSGLATSMTVTAYRPDGAAIGSTTVASGNDKKLDLGTLALSGNHSIRVIPGGVTVGAVDLALVAYGAGTLTIGGAAQAVALASAQNGVRTFQGTSGDLLNLAITSPSWTPAGGSLALTLYGPTGAVVASRTVTTAATWQLPQLTSTGVYRLVVAPPGVASATLGLQLTRR